MNILKTRQTYTRTICIMSTQCLLKGTGFVSQNYQHVIRAVNLPRIAWATCDYTWWPARFLMWPDVTQAIPFIVIGQRPMNTWPFSLCSKRKIKLCFVDLNFWIEYNFCKASCYSMTLLVLLIVLGAMGNVANLPTHIYILSIVISTLNLSISLDSVWILRMSRLI